MKRGNGLRRSTHHDSVRFKVEFSLEKIEADLLKGLAKSQFGRTVFGKPAYGQAVVYLLRVAFNCFREHPDRYQDPEPIPNSQALEEGLRKHSGSARFKVGKVDRAPSSPVRYEAEGE